MWEFRELLWSLNLFIFSVAKSTYLIGLLRELHEIMVQYRAYFMEGFLISVSAHSVQLHQIAI